MSLRGRKPGGVIALGILRLLFESLHGVVLFLLAEAGSTEISITTTIATLMQYPQQPVTVSSGSKVRLASVGRGQWGEFSGVTRKWGIAIADSQSGGVDVASTHEQQYAVGTSG